MTNVQANICNKQGDKSKTDEIFTDNTYGNQDANDQKLRKKRIPVATKMVNVSDATVNSDIFVDGVKTTIKAIKESKKPPNTKAIWQ